MPTALGRYQGAPQHYALSPGTIRQTFLWEIWRSDNLARWLTKAFALLSKLEHFAAVSHSTLLSGYANCMERLLNGHIKYIRERKKTSDHLLIRESERRKKVLVLSNSVSGDRYIWTLKRHWDRNL